MSRKRVRAKKATATRARPKAPPAPDMGYKFGPGEKDWSNYKEPPPVPFANPPAPIRGKPGDGNRRGGRTIVGGRSGGGTRTRPGGPPRPGPGSVPPGVNRIKPPSPDRVPPGVSRIGPAAPKPWEMGEERPASSEPRRRRG